MTTAAPSASIELSRCLEDLLGKSVEIKVNRNRRTMLSVLEKTRCRVRVSVHEMLLKAPYEVIKDAAAFIKSPSQHSPKVLRFFIQESLAKCRPSEMAFKEPVITQGQAYDLQKEWDIVNQTYFSGSLNVTVTWFGSTDRLARKQAILGMYDHLNDVIKIHRLLDQTVVPLYYLHYVLYHEALHRVYPPFMDENGVLKMHHATFKYHEKRFTEYTLARDWERSQKHTWFAA